MTNLLLWEDYSREEVHEIFSPDTNFTPQRGTWGLHGIVPIPGRDNDWVFFVTYGQKQGEHSFDESITEDGILSWQSQPSKTLTSNVIQKLIQYDDAINNIHLFLRTIGRGKYSYLGRLSYKSHDSQREMPVHFQWQLIDWPAPHHFLNRINFHPVPNNKIPSLPIFDKRNVLETTAPPDRRKKRRGVSTDEFCGNKSPNYALQDERNRKLGLLGETLVLNKEKETLSLAGRQDLADKVVHVSVIEGDGAGYDIRSYDIYGEVRFIEVKTTRGNAHTSFFISPNELEFSSINSNSYRLYRLYQFDENLSSAFSYILLGDIRSQLVLAPTSYRAELVGNG